ncbi:hypothetical protein [Sporomusa carbonis]|uniref:hypothetical protein n=1 Tax=Sporomusa carbonis TaxID=3076075 RepID=UPI003C7A4341
MAVDVLYQHIVGDHCFFSIDFGGGLAIFPGLGCCFLFKGVIDFIWGSPVIELRLLEVRYGNSYLFIQILDRR